MRAWRRSPSKPREHLSDEHLTLLGALEMDHAPWRTANPKFIARLSQLRAMGFADVRLKGWVITALGREQLYWQTPTFSTGKAR